MSITSFIDRETGKTVFRANYLGPHGMSSKTCASASEAQGFINHCKGRKPSRVPIYPTT